MERNESQFVYKFAIRLIFCMVAAQDYDVTPLDDEVATLTRACNSMAKAVHETANGGAHNFVSTLDHLPCDVVRCLWIVQSLELKTRRTKQKLHDLYVSRPEGEYTSEELVEIGRLRRLIDRYLLEARTEAKYLVDLLETHMRLIHDEQSLSQVVQDKLQNWTSEKVEEQWRQWCRFKAQVVANDPQGGDDTHVPGLKIRLRLKSASVEASSAKVSDQSVSPVSKSPTPAAMALKRESHVKKEAMEPLELPVEHNHRPLLDQPRIYSDEPLYCTCNAPATGRMVACENTRCKRGEWFHFKCVGLTREPPDAWFCSPECQTASESRKAAKRRRRRW